jgi:hypothetical protein
MKSPETVLYAGYGANRDPEMIEAITGNVPKSLGAVVLDDFELCVQRLDQTPDTVFEGAPSPISIREILTRSWGESYGFETYTIRPKIGSMVDAMLFEITSDDRALIANWEMIEFGWYGSMRVAARQGNGTIVLAETEGLREGQAIDRVVNGLGYDTYLNERTNMFIIAEQARLEYLER